MLNIAKRWFQMCAEIGARPSIRNTASAAVVRAKFPRLTEYTCSVYVILVRDGFTWDDDKADKNFSDHDVVFDEAADAFYDPRRVELFDEGHSEDEGRYVVIGFSAKGRLLFVSFKPLDNNLIRIIHSRVAERKWRNVYEENN